jgi:hypothetical protein
MYTVDAMKHMLLALYHHEPDDFECELQEIVVAIKTNEPYDNCPGFQRAQLIDLVNKTLDCVENGFMQERALRVAIRNILSDEKAT